LIHGQSGVPQPGVAGRRAEIHGEYREVERPDPETSAHVEGADGEPAVSRALEDGEIGEEKRGQREEEHDAEVGRRDPPCDADESVVRER